MSKRTAEEAFEESAKEAFEEDWKEPAAPPAAKVNSLDSDEEDEEDGDGEKYEIMAEDDIEGQEDGNVGHEGDIQLTPFNMKEEMEEGHFDTDGMYHWNKEKQVKDHWLDNINWVKIKEPTDGANPDETEEQKEQAEFLKPTFDDQEAYKKLLVLMKPGETVAKSLRRLGGNKTLSASERWKKKKAEQQSGSTSTSNDDKAQMNEMTELASNILTHTGNMDIYQETYEQIKSKVDSQKKSSGSLAVSDDLDMYADDFDEKLKQKLSSKPDEENSKKMEEEKEEESSNKTNDDVQRWEYKLKKEDDKIEGPFTSEQMQKWTESGKFTDEIWVRKYGTNGDFYTNKRIDFELYM